MPDPEPPRELRGLVPFEVLAVLVLAVVPLPGAMPVALPLLVVASLSRWYRRRDWAALLHADGWAAGVAAAAGLAALAIALVAGTPFVEVMSGRAVQWSEFPIVRGSPSQLVLVALVVIALAVATELALRGWIVERILELSPGPPVLPVLVGAIAEALVTPGDFAVRAGAGRVRRRPGLDLRRCWPERDRADLCARGLRARRRHARGAPADRMRASPTTSFNCKRTTRFNCRRTTRLNCARTI